MDAAKCQERASGRFEKVLRLYWDGIPIPPFILGENDTVYRTFILNLLNYSPDYYNEAVEFPLEKEKFSTPGFTPLCMWEKQESNISSRIASHHSPYVGLFKYSELKERGKSHCIQRKQKKEEGGPRVIRIPLDPCDLPKDWDDEIRSKYRQFVRTSKLLELYKPIVKEFCPIPLKMLREIVRLGTTSFSPYPKESVVSETQVVKNEYTKWMCEYIFLYMCVDPVYRKIFAPLQLITRKEPIPYTIVTLSQEERQLARKSFTNARKELIKSLAWKHDSLNFFISLKHLWNTHLKRLVLFDLSVKEWMTDAESFVKQIKYSFRSSFARLRIEFYSLVEEYFSTYVDDAKKLMMVTLEEYPSSKICRILTATNIFLVNELRCSIIEGLEKVVEFFVCFGNFPQGCLISSRLAHRYPVLSVNLIIGANSTPRAPGFCSFVVEIRSLFDEILEKLKELPRVEHILLPSLNFKKEPLNVLTESELAYYRSSLLEILDEASGKIDSISHMYMKYCTLPCKDKSISSSGDRKEICSHVFMLREKYHNVLCTTKNTVFCGRFAINCKDLKLACLEKWEKFLLGFYDELHRSAFDIIEKAEEICIKMQETLRHVPSTVEDLERYVKECEAAQLLASKIRNGECQEIINCISNMEESQVPIENSLYHAAEKLMMWPKVLEQDLVNSEAIKQTCKPLLRAQVNELRYKTRDHISSLVTGVTELYNMFNLDICDIAAQTCVELRDLVTDIIEAVETIHSQEKSLKIKTKDTFDDLYPLLNHFETVEQFWLTVHKTTALKEYYASTIPALSTKQIENVREWRRLIHTSTRNVRAYPSLVRLGRQQEVALARFEALEEFITLLTTPGLRKSHWKEIARLLAPKLQDDVSLVTEMRITLQRLLDADVLLHMRELKRIVSQAESDFHAESVLEEMKSSAKKIHFRVESVPSSDLSTRLTVPEECQMTILAHIEDYLGTCRMLRAQSGLSGPIFRALNEWEGSGEKTREMLFEWRKIEAQWIPLHNFNELLQKTQKRELKPSLVALCDRLHRAHDAFDQLYVKIGKPQFSLYMAIVQETIMDHLTAVKVAISEAVPFMSDLLEQKRRSFPRFNFLSDEQLMTYLSTYNTEELTKLLPFMYPRLADVEVKNNSVCSFTTLRGHTIPACPALPLSDSLDGKWINQFDEILARSVFLAIKECCLSFGKGMIEDWVGAHCPQMLEMGLRVVHTHRMRQALDFSGAKGLKGYQVQLKSIRNEICRLSLKAKSVKESASLSSALFYMNNAELDVSTAMKKKISNLLELDGTSMIQTFISDNDCKTRILGVDFANGNEFYGSVNTDFVMTPEIVERMITVIMVVLMGKMSTTVTGPKRRLLPFCVLYLLGRLFIPIQCFEKMNLDALHGYLRGAITVGGVLCFHDVELLQPEIYSEINELAARVTSEFNKNMDAHTFELSLPVGKGGTTIVTPIHRNFQVMFTSSGTSNISKNVSCEVRSVQLPSVECSTILRMALYTYGYPEETSSSLKFGLMYELFHRSNRRSFPLRNLTHIIRMAVGKPQENSILDRLCEAFTQFYYATLREAPTNRKMLQYCMSTVLGLQPDSPTVQRVNNLLKPEKQSESHEFFSRFTEILTASRRVLISGGPFTGKTRVWKKWVGKASHLVCSPGLVSASEIFSMSHPSKIRKVSGKGSASSPKYIIIEGGSYLRRSFWPGVEDYPRLLTGETSTILGKHTIIITTRRLHEMDPGVLSLFPHFHMEGIYSLSRFLRRCLGGVPHFDLTIKVVESVLGAIIEAIRKESKSEVASSLTETEYLLAAAERCTSLLKKWYAYSKETYDPKAMAEEEYPIDDRAFLTECVIFACSWGMGLSVSPEDQKAITGGLEKIRKTVEMLLDSVGIIIDVFPKFKGNAMSVFEVIPTPCGWKPFRETVSCGFLYSWSSYANINPQQGAWLQVFNTPSRSRTMRAAECLINCGQNILLVGESGSGKSTLLRTTRYCDRWIPCAITCSKGLNPSTISEIILSRLRLRSSKCFGPTIGRKLVVCVDDLHLSPALENGLTVASEMISSTSKFGALFTPHDGLVPVTDVVCCGTLIGCKLHSTVARCCVEIRLPPLDGDELTAGLWELFEACCARKRVAQFGRQAAAFISVAHSLFVRIAKKMPLPDRSAFSKELNELLESSLELVPYRFRDALRMSEAIRTNLLTFLPDAVVVKKAFRLVEEMYSAVLQSLAPDGVKPFRDALVSAADVTLGLCVRETVFKDMIQHNEILPDRVSVELQDAVMEWIVQLEESASLMKQDVLDNIVSKSKNISADDPELANRSMLIAYPSLAANTTKGPGTPKRKWSAVRLSLRQSSILIDSLIKKRMSRTYLTTWLVTYTTFLCSALRQEVHMVFISKSFFGCRRLMRLACHATGLPLAMFSPFTPELNYEKFKAELRNTITYALVEETGVVLYVPQVIFQLSQVPCLVDTLIRLGDVSELFTSDEMTALAKGFPLTQKSLRQLSLSETLELRRRVQYSLHFILHLESTEMVQDYAKDYPSMNYLISFTLHTASSTSILRSELSKQMLLEGDSIGVPKEELPRLVSKFGEVPEVRQLMGVVFDELIKIFPVNEDVFLDFARFVTRFRQLAVDGIVYDRFMESVVSPSGFGQEEFDTLEKNLKANLQKEAETLEELEALQQQKEKQQQEFAHWGEELKKEKESFSQEEGEIAKHENQLKEQENKLKHSAHAALHALKRAKPQDIRSFSQSRCPEKGMVLINAVKCFLGVDSPTDASPHPNERWNSGVRKMCDPDFFTQLSSVTADSVYDPASLLAMQSSLGEVRYTGSLVYGQLISNYILAVMSILRYREDGVKERKVLLRKQSYLVHITKYQTYLERVQAELDQTSAQVKSLEQVLAALKESQLVLEKQKGYISELITLVKQLSEFVVNTDVRQGECTGGDLILMGALFSILVMQHDAEVHYQRLQSILLQRGVRTSPQWQNAVEQVLFPESSWVLSKIIAPQTPLYHRCVLYALMSRLFWRCPLIGCVCEVFEASLIEIMLCECRDCIVVSAYDPHVKSVIFDALKTGKGLIIRDVVSVWAGELIRPLNDVLEYLDAVRRIKVLAKDMKKPTVMLYGKEVEVDSQFRCVCTSSSIVSCEPSDPMKRWFHVVNLYETYPHDVRYENLFFGAPTIKNLQEEVRSKRRLIYTESMLFTSGLKKSMELIATKLTLKEGMELTEIHANIEEVKMCCSQINHYVEQVEALVRQQREAWRSVGEVVFRSEAALRYIEFHKLERPWNDALLNPFIKTMWQLSPSLIATLSPRLFADLPLAEKQFYSLINYLETVLSLVSCGWPHGMRYIFALIFVSEVVSTSAEIQNQKGYLYSQHTEMLNEVQTSVLRDILSDDRLRNPNMTATEECTNAHIRKVVGEIYRESSDPLLRDLGSGGEVKNSDNLVDSFFYALLKFNLSRMESAAEEIVSRFFLALKDKNWLAAESNRGGENGMAVRRGSSASAPPKPVRLIEIHQQEQEMFERAVLCCFPICIVTQLKEEEVTLRRLSLFAHIKKLNYRFFRVTCAADMKAFQHCLMSEFYRSVPDMRGNTIVLHLDLPASYVRSTATMTEVMRKKLLALAEELEKAFTTYMGRGFAPYTDTSKQRVGFIVVVSQMAHDLLWGENLSQRNYSLPRCLYLSRLFVTPQLHLLDLMRTLPCFQGPEWGSKSPDAPVSKLASHLLLVSKEMLVVHVAMGQRSRMARQSRYHTHGSVFPEVHIEKLLSDDLLSLLVVLLSGWVRWSNVVIREAKEWVVGMSQRMDGAQSLTMEEFASVSAANHSLGTLYLTARAVANPNKEESNSMVPKDLQIICNLAKMKERQAYLYYRKQLRQWTSGTEDKQLEQLMASLSNVTGGVPMLNPVEVADRQLSSTIFNTFQKVAYGVLSSSGLNAGERKALQWLLTQVMVPPSSSDVVSCHYTDLEPPCPLVLEAETSIREFELEVAGLPSDLVELCGDGPGTETFCERNRHLTMALLFNYAGGGAESRVVLPDKEMSSPILPVRRKTSVAPLLMRLRPTVDLSRSKETMSPALPSSGVLNTSDSRTDSVGEALLSSASIMWRHDSDKLRLSYLLPNLFSSSGSYEEDSLLLSAELASPLDVQRTEDMWNSSSDGEALTKSSKMAKLRKSARARGALSLPWDLERDHAIQLLQFYFSTKSTRPQWECLAVVETFKCLATQTFGAEPLSALWLPALKSPLLTLQLVGTAIHAQLQGLLRVRRLARPEWISEGAKHLTVIVAQRRHLCAGDVVLMRASLSPSLKHNICSFTRWGEECFGPADCASPSSPVGREPVSEEVREERPTDVVIAVRMVEVKTPAPQCTVVMLESPPSAVWERPNETVVSFESSLDPRGFWWQLPEGYAEQLRQASELSPPQGSRGPNFDTDRRPATPQSDFSPTFLTNVPHDLDARWGGQLPSPHAPGERFHGMSAVPVEIFSYARTLRELRGDETVDMTVLVTERVTGGDSRNRSHCHYNQKADEPPSPTTPEPSNVSFAIERTWQKLGELPLCIIWEPNPREPATLFELPRDGLPECYIYIH